MVPAFSTWTMPCNKILLLLPAIASFAIGHGFSPLLLVVIVPQIVSLKYVSTALGVHKSLEQTGSTIFQTLAGLTLDTQDKNSATQLAMQRLLNIFFIFNVFHILTIVGLALLQRRKDSADAESPRQVSEHMSPLISPSSPTMNRGSVRLSSEINAEEVQSLLQVSNTPNSARINHTSGIRQGMKDDKIMMGVKRRGTIFVICCAGLILFAWVLFMGTAYTKLGSGKHDG